MKVTFGLNLDGIDLRPEKPLIGEVTVGPQGLLEILGTRLGLPDPDIPDIHRIAEFAGILETYNNGERFYSKSFRIDNFSTAKTLLNWRDEWIQAGWNGKCSDSASKRISDMVTICKGTTDSLSPGRADHVRQIIHSLEKRKTDLKVSCINSMSHLPAYLQEILTLLESHYTVIPEEPRAPKETDL